MLLTNDNWPQVLDAIASGVPEWSFRTWFHPLRFAGYAEGRLELGVPNRFIRRWLLKEYRETILGAVEQICGVRPEALVITIHGNLYREMRAHQQAASGQTAGVLVSAAGAPHVEYPAGRLRPEPSATSSEAPQAISYSGPRGEEERPALQRDLGSAPRAKGERPSSWQTPPPDQSEYSPYASRPGLHREFSLRNFVVGPSNRLAHLASLAVVESPTAAYHPLVLVYGASGLGKTHLLQGICHALLDRASSREVLYVSCEGFVNAFLRALQTKELDAFRRRYRSLDVLVVDDIQFLAGKERTQNEFFHTFETLYNLGKQIVLSCDAHPSQIDGLKDKLLTRLVSGLLAHIEAPNFETRLAVVASKAERRGWDLPQEVLACIARGVETNVRELEGALAKVVALAAVEGRSPDLALAQDALRGLSPSREGPVTLEEILRSVEKHFGVPESEIRSKRREKRVLIPRQVAMYLAKQLTDASFQTIGRFYGGRNHATVLHSTRKIARQLESNPSLRESVESLRRIFRA